LILVIELSFPAFTEVLGWIWWFVTRKVGFGAETPRITRISRIDS